MKTPRILRSMEGYTLRAENGEIGELRDFYFDDDTWMVRYGVAELGSWFTAKDVLIPVSKFGIPDAVNEYFPVVMKIDEIQNSPDTDSDMTVERRNEVRAMNQYVSSTFFSWETDFISTHNLNIPAYSGPETAEGNSDKHLRSANKFRRTAIHGFGKVIGHVRDFVINQEDWVIRDLVVDAGGMLGHKRILLPCDWIESIGAEGLFLNKSITIDKLQEALVLKKNWIEMETEISQFAGMI